MALIDSESVLHPISAAEPAGPNLEYDAIFAELERALTGKPEQQIGDVVTPAEDPEWNRVERLSLDLLGRTKDLRIACPLVRSLAVRHGMAGLEEGLLVVRALLERYWDSVHPQLEPDDGNDPTMRVNSLTALSSLETIKALRAAPIFQSRAFGQLSLRDCLAAGQGGGEAARLDPAAVDLAFQEIPIDELATLVGSGDRVLEHIQAIELAFDEHVGTRGPDLSRLTQLVHLIVKFIRPRFDERRSKAEVSTTAMGEKGEASMSNGSTLHGGGVGAPLAGEVRSRDDVVRALDKICDYYRRYEPSSPIPLLIERCKRLISMNFIDILKDLAPQGLSQAEIVTGVKRES